MPRIRLPVPDANPSDQTLTRFEERFVYRISRGVPAGMAVVAGVIMLIACCALLYSLVPPRGVRQPTPAAIPAEVAVSLEEVQRAVAESHQAAAVVADTTVLSTTLLSTAGIDPSWNALADHVHAIRLLFPTPTYTWTDTYQSYCAERYFDYCFRTERRRVSEGVSTLVHAALSMFDDGAQTEWIPESATRPEAYQLNVSNVQQKVAALGELEGILTAVPVEQRRQIASGWIGVRGTREAERNAQIQAEQARAAGELAAEEARFAAAQAQRGTIRSMSVFGIGAAIGSIWLLGLTLALLAIERNTRQLRSPSLPVAGTVVPRERPVAEPAAH